MEKVVRVFKSFEEADQADNLFTDPQGHAVDEDVDEPDIEVLDGEDTQLLLDDQHRPAVFCFIGPALPGP